MIECATVNAVTTGISARKRRNGITRQNKKQQMVGSIQDVEEAQLDELAGGLEPARIEVNQSRIAEEFKRADRSARRQKAQSDDYPRGQPVERRDESRNVSGPIGWDTRRARPASTGPRKWSCDS